MEFDEVRLLTELDDALGSRMNIEVFSMGAYSNPTQSGDYKRSVIPKGKFYPQLFDVAMQCDKDNIHPELVDWCDVVISMHNSKVPGQKFEQPWLMKNWKLFKEKGKKVVWRSIGQSVPPIEQELASLRKDGLKVVRYSPLERNIPQYAGEDALIRFYKDPDEFNGWNGNRQQVVTIAQSFKKRGEHLGYALFEKATYNLNRKVYGTENADLGELNGGAPSYEELKDLLRQSRCFFYYGTQPAQYTLSFIEAMMMGTPVVAVGKKLRNSNMYPWDSYEVPDIIANGVNGFVSDDIGQLRGYIELLLNDKDTAQRIGQAGRQTAIELFNKRKIMNEWEAFLRTL